jgi:hypothetical protein
MSGFKRAAFGLVLLGILGLCVSPANAQILGTGVSYAEGSSAFVGVDSPSLSGTVDWAVFERANFPFAGYTPDDDYVYVYQVHSDGAASVSSFAIGLLGDADHIGSFLLSSGDVQPSSSTLDPLVAATWDFQSPAIDQGGSSYGLVFDSPWQPTEYIGVVVNHGTYGELTAATPLQGPIPEPGTICLLVAGLGLAFVMRRCFR